MKILIINGPNINLMGIREPDIYGDMKYDEFKQLLNQYHSELEIFQSNSEGIIIDKIHQVIMEKNYKGLIINPGGYTHTSIAIMDALLSLSIPKVEVHLSDVDKRESFRQVSYTTRACDQVISGLHIKGYYQAIDVIKQLDEKKNS